MTLSERSCLLCRFEAKALVREEFGEATEDSSDQVFWKSFSNAGGESSQQTVLSKNGEMLTPTGDIHCQKMKEDF